MEPPAQITRFGGIANVRPYVGVFPQEAPSPVHQGSETPCRPARMPIAILTGSDPWKVEEGRFVSIIVGPSPQAAYPRGRQSASRQRVNIAVPPHIAYGSLFVARSKTHGLG